MRLILLDTDIGNYMDDMQALAYLLAQPGADLLGVTTVTGEAIARAELADMMLRLAGRSDVPVHAGSENPLRGAFLQTRVTPEEKALLDDFPHRADFAADTAVDFLRRAIEAALGRGLHHTVFLLPYTMAGQVDQLHTQARVLRCEYTAEGIEIEAVCDEICYGRLRGYEKK